MHSLIRENAESVTVLCGRIAQEADKFEELSRLKLQRTQRDTKRLLELQTSLEVASSDCKAKTRSLFVVYSEELESQVERLLELAEETWNEYMGLYREHRLRQERLKAEEQSRQTEAAKNEIETLLSVLRRDNN